MQQLQDFDTDLFKRAARMIADGGEQPPLVILLMSGPKDVWNIIDVSRVMSSETGKDMVADLIDMFSKRMDVAIVAFISEAWMVVQPGKSVEEMGRPSEHPNRQECIVVSFSLPNGKRALSVHKIHRPAGEKPFLERGALTVEEGSDQSLDGRFFAERRTIH